MKNPDPLVIAIAGPNGAGKTTLAPFLLRDHFGLSEYVNADTIALGPSAFQPEGAAFEAARVMLKRLHGWPTRVATSPSRRPWQPALMRPG